MITLQVNTTNDEVNDDLTLSLREAISRANEDPDNQYRIQLQAGARYELSRRGQGDNLNRTGDLDVARNSNITIEAIGGNENAIIDATGLGDSVFHVQDGSNLTLDQVTVTGGKQGNGAGLFIHEESTVTLQNSLVADNNGSKGAGIFVSNATLNVYASEIKDNRAFYSGGGVYVSGGDVEIKDSVIEANRARFNRGGGIFASERWSDTTIVIENSVVANNTADDGGGAVATKDGVELIIDNSVFERNTTTGGPGGGAIYAVGENSDLAQVTIGGQSRFEENFGENTNLGGGAIYGELAQIDVADAVFMGNGLTGAQDAAGGAILATDGSDVEVVRSQFIPNSVDVDRYGGGNGGAIASANNTNVTISDSNFSQNYASGTAGAIRLTEGSNTITQVTFDRNSSDFFGGAITLNRTDHTLIGDTLFQQNHSSDGGAFRIFDGSTTWENNVRFINNQAHGQAGGITSGDGGGGTIDGGTHRFDGIMADGNMAEQDAGFLEIIGTDRAVDVTIRQSEITNNRAEDDGGAIDAYSDTNGYATVQFDDVLVSGNTAGDSGGGVRFRDGVDVTLNHVRLVGDVYGL